MAAAWAFAAAVSAALWEAEHSTDAVPQASSASWAAASATAAAVEAAVASVAAVAAAVALTVASAAAAVACSEAAVIPTREAASIPLWACLAWWAPGVLWGPENHWCHPFLGSKEGLAGLGRSVVEQAVLAMLPSHLQAWHSQSGCFPHELGQMQPCL